ncbi:MAG: aldo/keto reductase [Nakamurella sp.]
MTTSPTGSTSTTNRRLGRSELVSSAIGLGTWPIAGAMALEGQALGYTGVDDAESLRAIATAVDLGVTLFDTADVYGAGHGERLLGQALADHPEVLVATKFGNTFDESTRQLLGSDTSPAYVRAALHASLRRLGRDRVDIYQLHVADIPALQAAELVAVLEDLVAQGTVRWYGVSTDSPEQLEPFLDGPHCAILQAQCNVLDGPAASIGLAHERDLGVLCRSPLAMGLLGGRHTPNTQLPTGDVRRTQPEWLTWFVDGVPAPEAWRRLSEVRDILTGGGRSLAQGAIAWVLATDPDGVVVPGFRTVAQVIDTVGTLTATPLTPGELDDVARVLGRVTIDG